MNFKEYEYVITLAEEKNFTKAAKRLFISQPSLSQYIAHIEEELGAALFERSGAPLALTREGELYIETAKKIINTHRRFLNMLDDSRKVKKGRLCVGITPSKANHPLPLILPVFMEQFPLVELSITEASSAVLEESLEKGLVDICILNLPVTSGGLAGEPVFTERILLAVPKTHELVENGKGFVTNEDIRRISGERFILLHPGQRLRQITNEVFAKAGIAPKILMETRNMETAVRLVSAGIGATFAPESFTVNSGLTSLPAFIQIWEQPLTWTLGIAHRKDGYVSKAAEAFAAVAKEVIRKMLGGAADR